MHVTRPFLQRDPRLLKLKRYTRIKLLTKFSGSFNEGNLLGKHFSLRRLLHCQASDEPTAYIDTEASEIKMACMVQTLCSDVFGIGGRKPSYHFFCWETSLTSSSGVAFELPQLALTHKLLELIRQLYCTCWFFSAKDGLICNIGENKIKIQQIY